MKRLMFLICLLPLLVSAQGIKQKTVQKESFQWVPKEYIKDLTKADLKKFLAGMWNYSGSVILKKDSSLEQKIFTKTVEIKEESTAVNLPPAGPVGSSPTNQNTSDKSAESKLKDIPKPVQQASSVEELVRLYNGEHLFTFMSKNDSSGVFVMYKKHENVMQTLISFDMHYRFYEDQNQFFLEYSSPLSNGKPRFKIAQITDKKLVLIDGIEKQIHTFFRN